MYLENTIIFIKFNVQDVNLKSQQHVGVIRPFVFYFENIDDKKSATTSKWKNMWIDNSNKNPVMKLNIDEVCCSFLLGVMQHGKYKLQSKKKHLLGLLNHICKR